MHKCESILEDGQFYLRVSMHIALLCCENMIVPRMSESPPAAPSSATASQDVHLPPIINHRSRLPQSEMLMRVVVPQKSRPT